MLRSIGPPHSCRPNCQGLTLGRAGASLPTDEVLRFAVAHAQARDAVHMPLDVAALAAELQAADWTVALADEVGQFGCKHTLPYACHTRRLSCGPLEEG